MMTIPTPIEAQFEEAKRSIAEAEDELRRLMADTGAGRRAEKVEVSQDVRAALTKLRSAREKLAALQSPVAVTEIEVAREALAEAQADLDQILDDMVVAARGEKTWVSEAVQAAFTRLDAVKQRLARLEEGLRTAKGGD